MTSDVQFLADMLIRVYNTDQITSGELNRLHVLRETGHSTIEDQDRPHRLQSDPIPAPHATDAEIAIARGATRVTR